MRALPTPVALPWQRSLNCSKAHATSTRGRLVRRGQAQFRIVATHSKKKFNLEETRYSPINLLTGMPCKYCPYHLMRHFCKSRPHIKKRATVIDVQFSCTCQQWHPPVRRP
eukprot:scaffold4386_cov138-Skeletonema_marinoi.AAC.15